MSASFCPENNRTRRKKASVLVLVLVVVSSLGVIAAGLAYRTKMEMRLVADNARRTRAYYLALGGIERIKALVSDPEASPLQIQAACEFNNSVKQENLFEQLAGDITSTEISLGYSVRDEKALFNINKSDPACWQNLGIATEEFFAALVDWIDPDDDSSPGGAETAYYRHLNMKLVSKNKPVQLLKELLYVRGSSRQLYLGEDFNRNFSLDDNEVDGMEKPPQDNEDNTLDLGLTDVFTVYGDAKININTAPPIIIAALPGLDEQTGSVLLMHRYGPDGQPGTDDDKHIGSAEQISDIENLTERECELLRQYCCYDSDRIRVFSHAGVTGDVDCYLMASLQLTEQGAKVICLERLL